MPTSKDVRAFGLIRSPTNSILRRRPPGVKIAAMVHSLEDVSVYGGVPSRVSRTKLAAYRTKPVAWANPVRRGYLDFRQGFLAGSRVLGWPHGFHGWLNGVPSRPAGCS